jgi:hypothetical protein
MFLSPLPPLFDKIFRKAEFIACKPNKIYIVQSFNGMLIQKALFD